MRNFESILPVVLRIYVKRIQSNLFVEVTFVMFRELKNKKETKSSISISLSFTVKSSSFIWAKIRFVDFIPNFDRRHQIENVSIVKYVSIIVKYVSLS